MRERFLSMPPQGNDTTLILKMCYAHDRCTSSRMTLHLSSSSLDSRHSVHGMTTFVYDGVYLVTNFVSEIVCVCVCVFKYRLKYFLYITDLEGTIHPLIAL